MGIVGGQQRRVELCDVEQPVGHLLFDFQAVVHEFDVEIIAAENVLEFAGGTQRVIELAQAQTSLDDARRAAGRGDDAFRIFGEDFLIHTRIAHDSAFKVRVGGGFHEVDGPSSFSAHMVRWVMTPPPDTSSGLRRRCSGSRSGFQLVSQLTRVGSDVRFPASHRLRCR